MSLRPLLVVWFALTPLAPALADEPLTIATWNIEWFFDDYQGDNYSRLAKEQSAPTRDDWNWRRDEVAKAIAAMRPTILCLQEVESQRICWYLTQQLQRAHQLDYRIAFIQGEDHFTEQDVAILYRPELVDLVEYSRREQTAAMRASNDYYTLQKHLFARFEYGAGERRQSLLLLNLHLRAMPEGAPIRQRQARLVRRFIDEHVANGANVIVLGDLNSEEKFVDTTDDGEIGILRGLDTPCPCDDLYDLHALLPADQRATHLLPREFDRILVSGPLAPDGEGALTVRRVSRPWEVMIRGAGPDTDHWNIYWQIPAEERDLSDHYPVVAEFGWRESAAAAGE